MRDRYIDYGNNEEKKELEMVPQGKYYLVGIALSEYKTEKLNLVNPEIDVEKIIGKLITDYGGRLRDGEVLGFLEANVKRFYNKDATRKAIINYLNELSEVITEKDSILIYYAGHGTLNKANVFSLTSYDYDPQDPSELFYCDDLCTPFLYVPNQVPKCRDLLIILDCCFAGGAHFGMSDKLPVSFSRQVLASASAHQKASDGTTYLGSPFANALCEVLDESPHPVINAEILFDRIKIKIKNKTLNKPQDISLGVPGNVKTGESNFYFINKHDGFKTRLLCDSILGLGEKTQLNFFAQTERFRSSYKSSKRAFNILVNAGGNDDDRQILARVLLKLKLDRSGCEFIPIKNIGYVYRKIHISSDVPVLNVFLKDFDLGQIKIYIEDKIIKPFQTFINALNEHSYLRQFYNIEDIEKYCQLIIYDLDMTKCTSTSTFEKIAKFCKEYYDQLKHCIEMVEDENLKLRLKKNLIHIFYIQAELEGGDIAMDDTWAADLPKKEINLLNNLPIIQTLSKEDFTEWLTKSNYWLDKNELNHPLFKCLSPDGFFPDEEDQAIGNVIFKLFEKCKTPFDHTVMQFFSIENPPVL